MTHVSVKAQYAHVYGGASFDGALKSHPMLRHGAWICEGYEPEAGLPLSTGSDIWKSS
jgi:hypothetical protein